MKTDVIRVSGKGNRFEAALKQADKVAAYKELSRKGALHLRLLTEEMMGMMRSITGEPEGDFWIEEQDGEYELHLRVKTLLSAELMGRLREFFDYGADETLLAGPLVLPDMYEHSSIPTLDWEWTMSRYEGSLYARMEKGDAAAKDAWDELEKSVVKHVADDIKVSIRGREVEMIILKKLA